MALTFASVDEPKSVTNEMNAFVTLLCGRVKNTLRGKQPVSKSHSESNSLKWSLGVAIVVQFITGGK